MKKEIKNHNVVVRLVNVDEQIGGLSSPSLFEGIPISKATVKDLMPDGVRDAMDVCSFTGSEMKVIEKEFLFPSTPPVINVDTAGRAMREAMQNIVTTETGSPHRLTWPQVQTIYSD